MTEAEVVGLLTALPAVTRQLAGPGDGSPEIAWGDSFFFFYEPDGPTERHVPFATIVTKDYPGFDTFSRLDRPDLYRLNLSVGRTRFAELFGFGPEEFESRREGFDYAELDALMPHPVYGVQSWVSVVVPGERTADQVRTLVGVAYERAVSRSRGR